MSKKNCKSCQKCNCSKGSIHKMIFIGFKLYGDDVSCDILIKNADYMITKDGIKGTVCVDKNNSKYFYTIIEYVKCGTAINNEDLISLFEDAVNNDILKNYKYMTKTHNIQCNISSYYPNTSANAKKYCNMLMLHTKMKIAFIESLYLNDNKCDANLINKKHIRVVHVNFDKDTNKCSITEQLIESKNITFSKVYKAYGHRIDRKYGFDIIISEFIPITNEILNKAYMLWANNIIFKGKYNQADGGIESTIFTYGTYTHNHNSIKYRKYNGTFLKHSIYLEAFNNEMQLHNYR